MLLAVFSKLCASIARKLGAVRVEGSAESGIVFFVALPDSRIERLMLGRITAITLGTIVIFASKVEWSTPEIRRHELVHVAQYKRVGVIRFLATYLLDYLGARVRREPHDAAYRSIRWEREAYSCQEDRRFPTQP